MRRSVWVLALLVGLFWLRFMRFDLAPFIHDEPLLQLEVERHFAAGTLPLVGLRGTRGLSYGPAPQWFYLAVRQWAPSLSAMSALHSALFGGAFLLLYGSLSLFNPGGALWALALVVSSPLLFFFSRAPWDNTFLVFFSSLTLFAVARLAYGGTLSRGRLLRVGALLGVSFGLMLSTHFMCLPLIGATVLWVFLWARAKRDLAACYWLLSPASIVAAVLTVPYVRGLSQMTGVLEKHGFVPFKFFFEILGHSLFKVGSFISARPISHVFEYDYGALETTVPGLRWAIYLLDLTPLLIGMGWFCACGMFKRFGTRHPPGLGEFATIALGAQILYFLFLGLWPMHLHYYIPIWFAIPVLVACSEGGFSRWIAPVVIYTVIFNTAVLGVTLATLARDRGNRTNHYGPVRREIESVTAELCNRMGTESEAIFDVREAPGLFPYSVQYFSLKLAACRGKQLTPVGEGSSSGYSWKIRYSNDAPYSARLKLDR